MSTSKTISAEAQGLYKIFNPGQPSKAEYDGERLLITGRNIRSFRNDEIKSVKLDLRWLHHAIVVTLKNGTNIELSGFREQAVRELHAAVSNGLVRHREAEAKQRETLLRNQADTLEADITALHPHLATLLPAGRYVRKSHAMKTASRIQGVTSRCTAELVHKMSRRTTSMLMDILEIEVDVKQLGPGLFVIGQAANPQPASLQVVDVAHGVQPAPSDAVDGHHNQSVALGQPGVQRVPAPPAVCTGGP